MKFVKWVVDKNVNKRIPTNKILIVILFWYGDRNQAMKLAKLLADLEPNHSDRADVAFVSRFDCAHVLSVEKYVARKFNTHSFTSRRRGVGWPLGCNSIFFGAMELIYGRMLKGSIPHYKAVLILGADSAPLRPNWLEQMHSAWDDGNKTKKICIAGAVLPGEHEHINGDCTLLSGDLEFLKWLVVDIQDVRYRAGWDWILADDFKRRGWLDLPFVKSLWRKPGFTHAEWDDYFNAGVSWIHGVKTDDVLDITRKNIL